jgi:hypothetical protein
MPANARLAARAGGLALLLVAGGCGSGGDADEPPALRPVRLAVSTPADTTVLHEETVEVRGSVDPPRSRVMVLGQRAQVSGGEFSVEVPLREGANLIDVGGSARGSAAAWATVRVVRESLVEVPELEGDSADEAVSTLESVGLRAVVREERGLFDELLPGDARVCETDPEAGDEVRRGTRVRLIVSKAC